MSDNQLNIKSSTIEKGLDLAKGFLGKIISPSVEQVGLLVADNIKVWRFKNQIRLLNNVEKYVSKKGINSKTVPIKILLPLLENSSLEENNDIISLWENLLINYVDANKNFTSTVYPKILSELSSNEARLLRELYKAFGYEHDEDIIYEIHQRSGYPINDKLFKKISKAELSNLVRLGILKESLLKDNSNMNFILDSYNIKISFTDLGIDFINACGINNDV
jgi:DNA integrity scanning protein DisA with diadenylate cyclase activity